MAKASEKNQGDTLSTQQVMTFLGISRTTLYRRIEAGEIVPLPSNPNLKKQPLKFDRAYIESLAKGE